ncbi:MAG: bifunctional nuclease family protein [Anaerolineaceae bacterium]|nr:MAG: bifunctional nuclease family protein [Anaerolineaceae bacterium]
MIEVVIDSVRVNLMSPQRLVVLREARGERFLPIWVGPYEAEAITIALQEVEVARPLTHDLIRNVLTTFNARINRIEIINLRDDIFYGNIIIDQNGRELSVDSRPSDAIALAVRAHVPIYVHPEVMAAASIVPEKDLPESAASQPSKERGAPPPPVDESSERLDVFKDFIDKLDLDLDKPDASPPDPKT